MFLTLDLDLTAAAVYAGMHHQKSKAFIRPELHSRKYDH